MLKKVIKVLSRWKDLNKVGYKVFPIGPHYYSQIPYTIALFYHYYNEILFSLYIVTLCLAASLASTPPAIIAWYLGFFLSKIRGERLPEFMGTSVLKAFLTSKVSGSTSKEPSLDEVINREKSLVRVNEFKPSSWRVFSLIILPNKKKNVEISIRLDKFT